MPEPQSAQRMRFNGSVGAIRIVPGGGDRASTASPAAKQAAPTEQGSDGGRAQQLLSTIHQTISRLESTIAAQAERREQFVSEFRQLAVDLACAVASRVVRDKIAADDYNISQRVTELTARLSPDSESLQIALHADDLRLLQSLSSQPPGTTNVQFVASSEIERGTCRAESDDKTLISDCSIELREIRRGLAEALR